MKIGDTVTHRDLGGAPHAIIARAPLGWWLQNLETGTLPMPYWAMDGFKARDMTLVGRYIEWSKSA